jgi:LmbE family N-acetylglucosaminyl deacetylase
MESQFIPYSITTVPSGRVLVLAPHPDDEIFGCGGAIMQHLVQGDAVTVVILTDGRAAIEHTNSLSMMQYIETRRQESRNAAAILGYQDLAFWEFHDRELSCDETLIYRLQQLIETEKFDNVYAPSPFEVHPDHYALAVAAITAVSRCQQSFVNLIMYEIAVPLRPNVLFDLTPFWERKQQAMACFVSQLEKKKYDQYINSLNAYRAYTLPEWVLVAEAYYVMSNEQLQAQPLRQFGHTRQTLLLEEFARKIERLNTELDTIYHSRSWWLTAPLRWINSFLYR